MVYWIVVLIAMILGFTFDFMDNRKKGPLSWMSFVCFLVPIAALCLYVAQSQLGWYLDRDSSSQSYDVQLSYDLKLVIIFFVVGCTLGWIVSVFNPVFDHDAVPLWAMVLCLMSASCFIISITSFAFYVSHRTILHREWMERTY